MAYLRALFVTIFAICFGVAAAFAAMQPTLNVGSSWTYKLTDGYGKELGRYTNTVTGRGDTTYTFTRTQNGAVVDTYDVAAHLGQVSPVQGNVGNGNLIDFPIEKSKDWDVISYAPSQYGVIKDELHFVVEGEESVTTDAGTFTAWKIVGRGTWKNINQSSYNGTLETIVYYSPQVAGIVKTDSTNFYRGGKERNIRTLVGFELK